MTRTFRNRVMTCTFRHRVVTRTAGQPNPRAVASLEFGLIAPVMGIFLMGLVDISNAIITLRRLNAAVQQIGLMATQLSVQPNQTTTLTVAQLNTASSIIYSVLPQLGSVAIYNAKTNPLPPYAVVVSDVVFAPTATGCLAGLTCTSYTANLAWSVPLQYGQQINRACGTITQTAATTNPSIVNNLPSSIPTAGITSALTSTLVVDIVYNYTPVFGKFFGPLTMRQTAYFNQRSIVAPYITYNTAGASSGGVVCTASGYV
jgi:Flp pilus assembly protein TadG